MGAVGCVVLDADSVHAAAAGSLDATFRQRPVTLCCCCCLGRSNGPATRAKLGCMQESRLRACLRALHECSRVFRECSRVLHECSRAAARMLSRAPRAWCCSPALPEVRAAVLM
jgi:hypothetical protein